MSQEIISEILEYEIMFTYNVTQKLKKWNDGKLKYFKFNNKVQIFNDDSILITQEFLQNDKLLQESNWGNEFKIGGVLITIESMISESTRDLTKMFKKDTVTPKTNIIYPKPQISNIKSKTSTQRTPLKDLSSTTQVKSPSLLGMKRRRVGLSKSMTPSKNLQSMNTTSNDELNLLASSRPIYHDKPVVMKPSLSSKVIPSKQKESPNAMESSKEPPTPKEVSSTKQHKKNDYHDDHDDDEDHELLDLSSPPLINSDKYLLLRPSLTTPDKQDHIQLSQIHWDDETITRSNHKIQTSLKKSQQIQNIQNFQKAQKTLITPKHTPRPIRRIMNNRSKREVIKINKPEISIDDETTPSKSKIEVYASDDNDSTSSSEYDEIKSQTQSQLQSQDNNKCGEITQTETYNYGKGQGFGYKVSDISKL